MIVTGNKLDHLNKMFGGTLESPHQSLRDGLYRGNSKYRLRFMVCVMVVNYRHITPDIVYGCASYRNILSIGEHVHLDPAFGDCEMQEANKGLHSLDYNAGNLHPNHHLRLEDWLSYAINQRRSKGEKRVKIIYTRLEKFEFRRSR